MVPVVGCRGPFQTLNAALLQNPRDFSYEPLVWAVTFNEI